MKTLRDCDKISISMTNSRREELSDKPDYTMQSTRVLLFTAMFMGMNSEKHPKVKGELRKIEREIRSRFPEQYKRWRKNGADYSNIHSFFAA